MLCAAFCLRIGMLWFVDYNFIAGDARGYLDSAHNILRYQIFSGDTNSNPMPSMYRPPLYSFFIAGIMWLFDDNPVYVQLIQVVISIITVFCITRTSSFFLPKLGPWVFSLIALSPFEAVYAGAILSETLVTFLLTATVCAILTFQSSWRWLIGGVLLGLGVLTRDIYMPLIIIFGFWIAYSAVIQRNRLVGMAIFILSACLVVAPWSIRNYNISGQFVPVSDGRLGLSLWVGTWAIDGRFTIDFVTQDASGQPRTWPSEAFRSDHEKALVETAFEQGGEAGDNILQSVAMQHIFEAPIDVLKVYFLRAPYLWLGTRFDIFELNRQYLPRGSTPYTVIKICLWLLNSLFMFFALLGILFVWRNNIRMLVLAIPILYTAIIYFPLNGFENRYSKPVYPFIFVFVGICAITIKDKYFYKKKYD